MTFNQLKSLIVLFILGIFATAFASEEIIKHKYFTLSYNEDGEVANWVSYQLEKAQLKNCVSRADNFRIDPLVTTGTATNKDYAKSGFDKGHLLPAGDMKFSAEAMQDTFYLSNVTPQPASFNRGRWGQLENLIRSWAFDYQRIWVVTGPVLEKGLHHIGQTNSIAVPLKYFKVIIRKNGSSYSGIGFLMETSVPSADLRSYVTSINEVEKVTKIDFFSFLDDSEEEKIEDQSNLQDWDFSGKFEYLPCGASAIQ